MKYIAKKERRISRAVMLQVNLEVVSRPGVLFSDCNATRHDAVQSPSPTVVRFDVVKLANHFAVPPDLVRFYQAEVLVPSPLPPDLIMFPDDVPKKPSQPIASKHKTPKGSECSKPKLPEAESTLSCKTRRCSSKPLSPALSPPSSFSSSPSLQLVADMGAAASLVLQDEVPSVSGDDGPRLLAKFIGWLVSMLLCRNHALVSVLCIFFHELRCYLSTLPLLQRLRLCRVIDLRQVFPFPVQAPVIENSNLCEFRGVPCRSAALV